MYYNTKYEKILFYQDNSKKKGVMMKKLFLLPAVFSLVLLAADEISYTGPAGPVTFGLPFKQGAVKDASKLHLNGRPMQVKVNGRWQDGSVKWALFDTDLPASFKGKFTVGKPHQGKNLYEKGVLSNGKIKVTFPEKGPLFVYEAPGEKGSAELVTRFQLTDPGPCEGENWMKKAAPTDKTAAFSSKGPRQVTVETNGPQRAVVRIAGEAGYKYIVRVTLWKNEDTLRIQTTFICSMDPNKNFLRSMVLKINRPGKTVQREFVKGVPRFHHMVSWRKKSSVQGKGVLHDGKLTAVVKDFARLFPKELGCDKKGLYFHIWPESTGAVLDLRRREKVDRRYLDYTNPAGGFGVAKTHDLYLSWSNPRIADRVNNFTLATMPASYWRNTLACGEYMLRGAAFPKLDALIDFSFEYLHVYKRQGHFDGMMDWGDIPLGAHGMKDHMGQGSPESAPFRGYTGWSNSDFNMATAFYIHFLRTGDQQALRDGLDFSWHLADVDTVHDWPKDEKYMYWGKDYQMTGLGRRHDQQHWGTPPIAYGYSCDDGVYAYLLTGEERFLEVSELVGSNPRTHFGRFMSLRLYEITGKKKYLDRFNKDLAAEKTVPRSDNFRGNAYDGFGYLFIESMKPGLLKEKVLAGAKKYAPRYHLALLPKGYPPYVPALLAYKYDPTPYNLDTLKALVYLLKNPAGHDWTIPEKKTMDQFDKKWKSPNLPVAALMYWNTLPYLLETLRKAGVTEEECFKYTFKWQDLPSQKEELTNIKRSAYPQNKHYYCNLKKPLFSDWGVERFLNKEDTRRYRLALQRIKLYEDGRLIGPGCSSHRAIMSYGYPGWSCTGGSLMMNASDNSDPGKNGRKYVFVYTSEKDWKWEDKPSFNEKLVSFHRYPTLAAANAKPAWYCASPVNESPDPVLVPEPSAEDKKNAADALKRHTFTENGKVLKNWYRLQNLIVFQTSDGSDPRTNGREYRLVYKNKKDQSR